MTLVAEGRNLRLFLNGKPLGQIERTIEIDKCVAPEELARWKEVIEQGYSIEIDCEVKLDWINHFILDEWFGGRPENYSQWYGGA